MASTSESSSSSRSRSSNTLMPGRIVIAFDATKNHNAHDFKALITNIQTWDGMIQEVDTITVLGVLHKVLHPMGFQMQIGPDSFIGTRVRAVKEEVSRMVGTYVGKLQHSAEQCMGNGVNIEVKIVVGAPLNKVVVQEAVATNATWIVLNRYLRKELRFYLRHIPCKIALVLDDSSLEILRPYYSDKATATIEHKLFYSLSKLVPLLPHDYNGKNEQSVISPSYRGSMSSQESPDSEKSSLASVLTSKSEQNFFSPDEFGSKPQLEKSGSYSKANNKYDNSPPLKQKQSMQSYPDVPVPCIASEREPELDSRCNYSEIQLERDDSSSGNIHDEDNNAETERDSDDSYTMMKKQMNLHMDYESPGTSDEMKTGLDSKGCSYAEIQIATNDFSSDNLLGEGGYGVVYKGQLKNGQLITVKVQKEANTQGSLEFHAEVCVLTSVCHKNVVMLLGYCCKENVNFLVYEYICNKSLEWHLFDSTAHVLEWHQRHAIAVGIAKGLRFLHEECWGSPIIHRDIRPSNIFLTHEFVPLLGNCGLAKWKTNSKTKIHGTLEYIAPEYVENGICSLKTDIFAFGIVLIQLISGRKAVDSMRENYEQSLRQWAMPLIQTVALDELVDPRLGDTYRTYELYQMARAAYLCTQSRPASRPTVEEVLHLLEGKNNHLQRLTQQFIPQLSNHAITSP